MTFENLPADWPTRSLADPDLAADVVDLMLTIRDRQRGALLLLFCDELGRALHPVVVTEMDWYITAEERARPFRSMAEVGAKSLVVAVSAKKPVEPEVVQRWRITASNELAGCGVPLLGFYSADASSVEINAIAA